MITWHEFVESVIKFAEERNQLLAFGLTLTDSNYVAIATLPKTRRTIVEYGKQERIRVPVIFEVNDERAMAAAALIGNNEESFLEQARVAFRATFSREELMSYKLCSSCGGTGCPLCCDGLVVVADVAE